MANCSCLQANGTTAAPIPIWAVVNIPGWKLAAGRLLDQNGGAETLLPFDYNGSTCENASYCGDMYANFDIDLKKNWLLTVSRAFLGPSRAPCVACSA